MLIQVSAFRYQEVHRPQAYVWNVACLTQELWTQSSGTEQKYTLSLIELMIFCYGHMKLIETKLWSQYPNLSHDSLAMN